VTFAKANNDKGGDGRDSQWDVRVC